MSEAKPFCISRHVVWEAWQRVRANQGGAGVDEESIQDFEHNLRDNLYKVWNRMSSGSYFPPPVRTVLIPKSGGGERRLGIPTVADRVAQMVVKMTLEPLVEPHFHPESYGYRPGRSAHQAVGQARRRCWRYDWVLDLDVRGFFDNIDHELMLKAVRKHTDCRWVLLYVERWLKAPAQLEDGVREERDKGTPQGGVISPLLANLFLHYTFDEWMRRNYPAIVFERYADDMIVHCRSLAEAGRLRQAIAGRMRECRLELHPEKTKIAYCKDSNRPGEHEHVSFDFLGFTFRPRKARNQRGVNFVGFTPAISDKAAKRIRQTIKQWKLHRRSDLSLEQIASLCNPKLRGWIHYYGRFRRSELYRVFNPLEKALGRWATRKYKRLRRRWGRAMRWLRELASRQPRLFAHWQLLPQQRPG
ncbi:group II intron reverse transcriptase/maturase [Candidatus Sumerlaeota bacterium]